jgi:hypothetical protein
MLRGIAVTMIVWAAVLPAPAALGQQIDPTSPTAKEYALPLESARKQASGDLPSGGGAASREEPAPLFGEGIEAAASSSSPQPGRGAAAAGGDAERPAREGEPAPAPRKGAAARILATARPGAPEEGGLSPAVAGAAGLVLLLAAAGLGVALRRRARPDQPSR